MMNRTDDQDQILDPRIGLMLDELYEEYSTHQIACLVAIVVHPDGSSDRRICGSANPITLLGSIEMLKALVAKDETMKLDIPPERHN